MQKCEECLRSRIIVSENGYHAVCCLAQKKAMNCMTGVRSYFIGAKKCVNEEERIQEVKTP